MKKYSIIFSVSIFIAVFLLLSCSNGTLPPGFSDYLGVSIDGTDYLNSAEYNFGITEAESSGKITLLDITNTGDIPVTVTSAVLGDGINYSLTGAEFPFTFNTGETKEISLTFKPQSSGSHPSTISINIDGADEPFVLKLSGEGNYAPTVKFGIMVSGAGNAAANGFYDRTGFHVQDLENRPLYTKTGSVDYYCYIYPWDGAVWAIDNTLTAGGNNPDPQYSKNSWPSTMVPPVTGWSVLSTGTAPAPGIIRYDITGTYAASDEVLTAEYLYSDAEGDAESTSETLYQWYRSDSENGTYTAIAGAASKTYTTVNDSGYFIKVEITPAALSGIPAGPPVMSSPTIQIDSYLQ